MRLRRSFIRRTCCVSARPSSHGMPACLIELKGDAPVPPLSPEMRTTSACALATPAATVTTPITVGVFAVALLIFAALAGIRLPSDAVHRDSECLVGFLADRSE